MKTNPQILSRPFPFITSKKTKTKAKTNRKPALKFVALRTSVAKLRKQDSVSIRWAGKAHWPLLVWTFHCHLPSDLKCPLNSDLGERADTTRREVELFGFSFKTFGPPWFCLALLRLCLQINMKASTKWMENAYLIIAESYMPNSFFVLRVSLFLFFSFFDQLHTHLNHCER